MNFLQQSAVWIFLWILRNVLSGSKVEQYTVKDNRILDSNNRECFFHGVNVVYKSAPYLPVTDHFDSNLSFSTEDMQLLHDLGQNIIRLGVMWPGVAPQRGSFNGSYIESAIDLITTAYNDYNITTLVDCHQDVLAEQLCGEGAPGWAIETLLHNFPEPLHSAYSTNGDHIPSRDDCLSKPWSSYYAAEETSNAFQRLYQNHDGIRDAFADYWGVLASKMKNVPGIVGFELLNEPWAGGIYDDPLLMLPGEADRKNLAPFYDAVVPVIYGNDSNRLVFFESVTWTDELNASWTETGFDHVPGGQMNANRSVFSFHYYRPLSGPNLGDENQYFYERTHDAIRWKSTGFLTEFDIANEEQTDTKFVAMSTTMDLCDSYLISWIGWEYKAFAGSLNDGTCTGCAHCLFQPDGTENVAVRKAISRTYAQNVAGKTKEMKFDWISGRFTLSFEMESSIREPTVIYTNAKYWYKKGFTVTLSPSDSKIVDYRIRDNYVEIYNGKDGKHSGQLVTVDIVRK